MSASKYSKKKCKYFRQLVAIGMTFENAAVQAFKIHRATYFTWMSEESTLEEEEKNDILEAKELGRSELNNRLSLYILRGAKDDAKIALDYLKRLETSTYGDSQKVIGDKDNPINVNHAFSDDQLRRILSKPAEAEGGESN